jgi:hypothetical protein
VVTFTTLGNGDIHPVGYSHYLASAEALTGAFFMALFVVVFVRKMARRIIEIKIFSYFLSIFSLFSMKNPNTINFY